MGVWGAALFADDDAADLREDYRAYLGDAQSDAGATDLAARGYDASLDQPGETTEPIECAWGGLCRRCPRCGGHSKRMAHGAFSCENCQLDFSD